MHIIITPDINPATLFTVADADVTSMWAHSIRGKVKKIKKG